MTIEADDPQRENVHQFPPEQRLRQMTEAAKEYLRRPDLPVCHEDRPYIANLASIIASPEGWDSFEGITKRLRLEYTDGVVSAADLKLYLATLKRAINRVLRERQERADRQRAANATISDIEGMLDSDADYLVCQALLMKYLSGRIWFDSFKVRFMTDWNGEENLGVVAAHEIDDPFMLKIRTWLMKKHVEALGKINQTMVVDAVSYVAYRDERDSLKDHVNRLPAWDGTPRISTWLVEGFGCEVNDEVGQTANYIKAVGKNLLIGMIARALDPGCKVDTMPIFYGPQGARKSSAMAVLATEEFFAEISEPPNSKDFYIGLQGIWLGEVAELASIASRAAEVEKVKGMVSRQRDRYRPPYAKNAQDFPRRIKFVGTTNALTFMRDETGNRRYPTLHVGNIDLDWIKANRDQLLAEALRDYRAGATWWDMPMDDHARVVEAHQTTASFHDDIAERLLDASLYDGTAEGPRGIAEDVAEPLDPQRMVERWGNVVTVMRVGIVWLGLTVAEVERQNRTIAATLRRLGWVTAHSSMRTVAGRRKAQRCWVVADKVERTRLRAAGELVGVTSPEPEIPF